MHGQTHVKSKFVCLKEYNALNWLRIGSRWQSVTDKSFEKSNEIKCGKLIDRFLNINFKFAPWTGLYKIYISI